MATTRFGKLSDFSPEQRSRMREQLGLIKLHEIFGTHSIFWCDNCERYVTKVTYEEDFYTDRIVFRLECHNRIRNYSFSRSSIEYESGLNNANRIPVFVEDRKAREAQIPKRSVTAEERIVMRLLDIAKSTGVSVSDLYGAFHRLVNSGLRSAEAFERISEVFASPGFGSALDDQKEENVESHDITSERIWGEQLLREAREKTHFSRFVETPEARYSETEEGGIENRVTISENTNGISLSEHSSMSSYSTSSVGDYEKEEQEVEIEKTSDYDFYKPNKRKKRKLDI